MTRKCSNHPGFTSAKMVIVTVLCAIPLMIFFADGTVRTLDDGDRELLQVFKDNSP